MVWNMARWDPWNKVPEVANQTSTAQASTDEWLGNGASRENDTANDIVDIDMPVPDDTASHIDKPVPDDDAVHIPVPDDDDLTGKEEDQKDQGKEDDQPREG